MEKNKLLAAVAIMAMVFAVLAMIPTGSDEADAAVPTTMQLGGYISANQDVAAGITVDIVSDIVIGNGDDVDVTLTVEDGAKFVLPGSMSITINEGSTLALNIGAIIDMQGSIIVDGGTLSIITGTVDDGDGIHLNGNVVVKNGGTITGISGSIATSDLFIGGTFNVGLPITDAGYSIDKVSSIDEVTLNLLPTGTVIINGDVGDKTVIVEAVSASSEVVGPGSAVTITSGSTTPTYASEASYLTFTNSTDIIDAWYSDASSKPTKVQFTEFRLNVTGDILCGDMIAPSAATPYDGDVYTTKKMDAADKIVYKMIVEFGNIDVKVGTFSAGTGSLAEIESGATVNIADDVNAKFTLGTTPGLTVLGNIEVYGTSWNETDLSALMIVAENGKVIVKETSDLSAITFSSLGIVGALYKVPGANAEEDSMVIQTLSNAIQDAPVVDGFKTITVQGAAESITADNPNAYVLEEDVVLDKIKLTVIDALVIPKGVEMSADAAITITGSIVVNGSLISPVPITLAGQVYGEAGKAYYEALYTTQGSTLNTYTSVVDALDAENTPGTVTVQDGYTVTDDLTIPEGFMVVLPTNKTFAIDTDKTLFVEGLLDASAESITISVSGKTVIDGYVMLAEDSTEVFPGVFFVATLEEFNAAEKGYYTSLGNYAENYANDYAGEIRADVKFESAVMISSESASTLTLKSTVEGDFVLENFTLDISNATYSGNVSDLAGNSVDFVKVKATTGVTISSVTDDATVMAFEGSPVNNTGAKITIIAGALIIGDSDVGKVEAFDVAAGAQMLIEGSVTNLTSKVEGTITIVAGISGVTATALEVMNGGALYVDEGVTARFNNTSNGYIYAYAGSTIGEKALATNAVSTEYYYKASAKAEDYTLYLTAYASTVTTVTIGGVDSPIEDLTVSKWVIPDDDAQTDEGDTVISTGVEDGKVYAIIDYDVYTVVVYADNAIASVSISGIPMVNVAGVFKSPNDGAVLFNGQTEYTIVLGMASGQQDRTVLITLDGEQIVDGKFTLSGTTTTKNIYITTYGEDVPIVPPVTSQDVAYWIIDGEVVYSAAYVDGVAPGASTITGVDVSMVESWTTQVFAGQTFYNAVLKDAPAEDPVYATADEIYVTVMGTDEGVVTAIFADEYKYVKAGTITLIVDFFDDALGMVFSGITTTVITVGDEDSPIFAGLVEYTFTASNGESWAGCEIVGFQVNYSAGGIVVDSNKVAFTPAI